MSAAVGRHRGVRDLRAQGLELFVDPHQIALAGADQLHELVVVGLAFSARLSAGTWIAFEARILRTAFLEMPSAREIARLP